LRKISAIKIDNINILQPVLGRETKQAVPHRLRQSSRDQPAIGQCYGRPSMNHRAQDGTGQDERLQPDAVSGVRDHDERHGTCSEIASASARSVDAAAGPCPNPDTHATPAGGRYRTSNSGLSSSNVPISKSGSTSEGLGTPLLFSHTAKAPTAFAP